MQRVVGIALGYEDLVDHDELRHDPVLATLAGKLSGRRSDCAPLAGKSTLNRLELSRAEPTRYAKLAADTDAIETLFVDLFLDAHQRPPAQITLDLDATDNPLLAVRKAGSSTATTTATLTYRFTFSAAGICWRRSCGARISMPPPDPGQRPPAPAGRQARCGPAAQASCAVRQQRRWVEPLALSAVARKLRHGVPSHTN